MRNSAFNMADLDNQQPRTELFGPEVVIPEREQNVNMKFR